MRDTIYYLIYISAGVSIFATFIVCLTFLKNSLFKNKSTLDATNINSQINACRWASVVFTVLEWFLYSCESEMVCLLGYQELSLVCSQLGVIWIIFGFVCVLFALVLILRKADSPSVRGVSEFRNSSFLMGGIFLALSFFLNVG